MVPRFGEPADIAAGVVYLAADESKYVTGTELTIDGGALVPPGAARARLRGHAGLRGAKWTWS